MNWLINESSDLAINEIVVHTRTSISSSLKPFQVPSKLMDHSEYHVR